MSIHNLQFELDDLRKTIQKLENCLSDMVSKLENLRINGAMQSSLTQTNSEFSILRERLLPGHQFCLTSIALPIELAKRVGFRVTADAM